MMGVMDFKVKLVEKAILKKYYRVNEMARPYNLALIQTSKKKHEENATNFKNIAQSNMIEVAKNFSNADLKNVEELKDNFTSNISAKNIHHFERGSKRVTKEQSEFVKFIKNEYQQPIGIKEEEKVQNLSNIVEQQEVPFLTKYNDRRAARLQEEIEDDASFGDYE
jgi:hypothetical protein